MEASGTESTLIILRKYRDDLDAEIRMKQLKLAEVIAVICQLEEELDCIT